MKLEEKIKAKIVKLIFADLEKARHYYFKNDHGSWTIDRDEYEAIEKKWMK